MNEIDVCKAVLEWAATPGTHGMNPYGLKMVIMAEQAVARSENRKPESWANHPEKAKIIGNM